MSSHCMSYTRAIHNAMRHSSPAWGQSAPAGSRLLHATPNNCGEPTYGLYLDTYYTSLKAAGFNLSPQQPCMQSLLAASAHIPAPFELLAWPVLCSQEWYHFIVSSHQVSHAGPFYWAAVALKHAPMLVAYCNSLHASMCMGRQAAHCSDLC